MARHKTSLKAERLRKVLTMLETVGRNGVTTRWMQTYVNRASDAIYDLRHPAKGEGVLIGSAWEKSLNGKTHKRYWLAEHAPEHAEVR